MLEAPKTRPQARQAPEPAPDQGGARPVRHQPGAGQEGPLGRRLQPLQADQRRPRGRRGRAPEVERPARRADRLGQDAPGPDPRPGARRPVLHRRRDEPDRGRLRRRGRREHPPAAHPGGRLRRRPGPARDHLHRRDRQDRAQGGQPVDHPRRLGRGRPAGAPQDPRGDRRQRPAPGRPEASPPGLHPDRHDQRPVHLRRRVRRAGEDRRGAGRTQGDRLRLARRQITKQERGKILEQAHARGPPEVRAHPRVRRPAAGGRHPVGADGRGPGPRPDRAEERGDPPVPALPAASTRWSSSSRPARSRRRRRSRSTARPAPGPCARSSRSRCSR